MLVGQTAWLVVAVTVASCLREGLGLADNIVQMSQNSDNNILHRKKWDAWIDPLPSNTFEKRYLPTQTSSPATAEYPFRNASLPWAQRVDNLVSLLTLEEIMVQTMTNYTSPGTQGIPRLGIGPYPWITECLRGQVATDSTAFPQALGLSSAFSPELMFNLSTAISTEVRAHWNMNVASGVYKVFSGLTCYSPVINIMRHPLWGRNQETYGEDPYLTGTLSQQFVKGLQGYHPRYRRVTATCKHFDAHGGPDDIPVDRYGFNAQVSKRDWWMTFLPQFRLCIGAGAGGVMCSYNSINGIPSCANKELLSIARDRWNFTGYITGDAGAIQNIVIHHHYLPNNTMAAAAVLNAGCNMEISGNTLGSTLKAMKVGLLTEKKIRDNVKPLFYVRMRHGEFDPPSLNPYSKLGSADVKTPAHRELAIQAAMMTFVLLKNKRHFLPLKNKYNKLAMVGPLTHDPNAQAGDYAANVDPRYTTTPYDGLRKLAATVIMETGCQDARCTDYNSTAIKTAVTGADIVIVSLGLGPVLEAEMTDRTNIDLPGSQFDLLMDAVYWAKGRPVLLLLFTAGPIDLTWAIKTAGVSGILLCFYPAQATGTALYRTLTMTGPGPASPAGRLTSTWPAYLEQVGPITDYTMYGRTYRYFRGQPLFPFGYGLSYSNFRYSHVTTFPRVISHGRDVTVCVTVKNIGTYDADEVVQVYLSWEAPSLPAPRLQLVGFQRVSLPQGEDAIVKVTITAHQMALWMDDASGYVIPKGIKRIYVGGQQPNQRMVVPSNVLTTTFNVQ